MGEGEGLEGRGPAVDGTERSENGVRRIGLSAVLAATLLALVPAVAAAAVPAGATAATNLVTDGGFETPGVGSGFSLFSTGQQFQGWTVVGASGNVGSVSGTFTQSGFTFPADSGKQWLDLTGESESATGVEQTVKNLAPGTRYTLSFAVGNVSNPGGIFGTTSTVQVFLNRASLMTATNANGSGTTTQVWQTFSKTFVAPAASVTISFINLDPASDTHNGLDAVTLVRSTPGPASTGRGDGIETVPDPGQLDLSVKAIATTFGFAGIMLLLALLASELINATLERNWEEIRKWPGIRFVDTWFDRLVHRHRDGTEQGSFWSRPLGYLLFLVIATTLVACWHLSVRNACEALFGVAIGSGVHAFASFRFVRHRYRGEHTSRLERGARGTRDRGGGAPRLAGRRPCRARHCGGARRGGVPATTRATAGG